MSVLAVEELSSLSRYDAELRMRREQGGKDLDSRTFFGHCSHTLVLYLVVSSIFVYPDKADIYRALTSRIGQ